MAANLQWKSHHAAGNVVDGRKIRMMREQRGWTKEQFAELCDMTVHNLARIENGDGNTSTGKVRSIADSLGVNPASLIIGVDDLLEEKKQPIATAPELAFHPNRDIILLRAFVGNEPAFLQIGSHKSDVPEEILGDILHVITVYKLKTEGKNGNMRG